VSDLTDDDGAPTVLAGTVPAAEPRIGPYRLVRVLGHGGMGKVFLGIRDDESFHKRVAIKVLKRGMDTEAIVSRFRHERQVLASLNHPNIAGLLDGGTTPNGLPYFAMEYIEGQNIVDFCESRKLDTTARLQLFRQVCSAVQYAHQNLIVHRDIKPHNVLVTSEGTPKLLDFGIAKLLNPELAGETLAPTAGGAQLMTPEYASPEQVLGHPVTTATDVYSLGVLLYELLTNRRPYRLASRTPADIARVVCESVPARPSTAVTQLPDPAAHDDMATGAEAPPISTAGTGGRPIDADAHRLRRRLAGDLDNIVLKALSKEPDRRYASADQFSEDVRRHLAGLPVIARPDTLRYRASKFVRRNRGAIVAGSVVFAALVAGVAGTASQATRANAERVQAEQRFDDVRGSHSAGPGPASRGRNRLPADGRRTRGHRRYAWRAVVRAAGADAAQGSGHRRSGASGSTAGARGRVQPRGRSALGDGQPEGVAHASTHRPRDHAGGGADRAR
jgi:serine/threonine protein kinase